MTHKIAVKSILGNRVLICNWDAVVSAEDGIS